MVDLTQLNKTIDALTAEVAKTEGTEDSAAVLIAGFASAIKTAVTAALTADAAANSASIAAANKAISDVEARFAAADDKLGAAIAANPLPAPTPVTPPVVPGV